MNDSGATSISATASPTTQSADLIRFGVFELDPHTGELRKHGIRIKFPDQPFRILIALLERPGQLVTREELRQRIWPGDTAGDFEQGLNRAVSKLREALSDKAVSPRFVETLPGRGYRFIGTVEDRRATEEPQQPGIWRKIITGAAACVVLIGVIAVARLLVQPVVPPLRWKKLTTDNYVKSAPALSDGTRIYFAGSFEGEQFIAQVALSGGQPTRLPITPPAPVFNLQDLSPDGQEVLLTAAPVSNRQRLMPLWTLRISDGTARRLGAITATSAAYAPSGRSIAFSNTTELWTASIDGSQAVRLVELKDSLIGSVSWSPDGNRIRFSRRDPLTNYASPWEIMASGNGLRQLFPKWRDISLTPSGWSPDGKIGIFGGAGTFWAAPEGWSMRGSAAPEQVLKDAPEFDGSIRVRSGGLFHAVGTDRLGELQHYDESLGYWLPLLDGISAEALEYSPDGRRMAYVTYPQRTLWVRQVDGSRPIQLTSQPLVTAFPRWSPDGKRIAFSGGEAADKPMRLYLVDADGGPLRPVLPSEKGSQSYPTWSPDGKRILYGILSSSTREEVYIRVADLETGKVTRMEGSEGLFAPRWSPDGKTIAALQFAGDRQLMLYHLREHRWEKIGDHRADWPAWAPDSKSIVCKIGDVLARYQIDTRKFETITELKPEEMGGNWGWIGVGTGGTPIRTLNRDSRQIYALQFEGM